MTLIMTTINFNNRIGLHITKPVTHTQLQQQNWVTHHEFGDIHSASTTEFGIFLKLQPQKLPERQGIAQSELTPSESYQWGMDRRHTWAENWK